MRRACITALATLGLLTAGAGPFEPERLASAACSVQAPSPELNFGTYSVFGSTPVDVTGLIQYSCDTALVSVRIDLGVSGSTGTFAPRYLDSSLGDYLAYNLYRDPPRTSIWGDGTAGTSFFESSHEIVPGAVYTVPVYLRIPAGQDVIASGYTDSLWATLVY